MSDSVLIIMLGIGMIIMLGILSIFRKRIDSCEDEILKIYGLMNKSYELLSESDRLLLLLLMKVRQ